MTATSKYPTGKESDEIKILKRKFLITMARYVISTPGSSLEDPGIHRNTQTTSPLHRPEEVVLMAPDGSLDASERTAE